MNIQYVLGNLTDFSFVKNIFKLEKIDIFYHAAAYKHVDLLEKNYVSGIKNNILRKLIDRNCEVTVFPYDVSISEIEGFCPDGIFLSNGPGDPEPCCELISLTKSFITKKIPIFGICLGHQILALALGAQTEKMKFGHHGANHPVQDLLTKKVFITSQNHCYTVNESSLEKDLKITHKSLFDGTVQGIEHISGNFFSFQGHPEASPGPQESDYLFDKFINERNSFLVT